MSAGTREVLINPELTAKPVHPLGGIRESKEYQHTYPHITLNTLTGMLKWNAGLKGCNCSSLTWLSEEIMLLLFLWVFFPVNLVFGKRTDNDPVFKNIYDLSVSQMRKCHWSEALIKN